MDVSRVAEPRKSSLAFTWLLAALTAMTAMSVDMSLPAMPILQQVFRADVAEVQLTLSLFLLGFAAGHCVSGPLSDRLGRRPVLLAGLSVFSVAGFLCAFSPSLPWLVLGRCLQGLGASAGPVIARAIVRDRFEGRDGAAVLTQITQVMILAPLLAPTLGSHLLEHLGWHTIFLVLGVTGVFMGFVCWRRLPETCPRQSGPKLVPYLRESFRSVLGHRAGLAYTLTACFAYAGMFGYISGSPFVFMHVFHVPSTQFGYLFAVTALCLLAGATVNRMLLPRCAPNVLLRWGVRLVWGAGLLLAALAWFQIGGLPAVVGPMMLYMFGQGLLQPNATTAAMAPHPKLAGVASSLIGALQTAGGALAGYCVGMFYDHTTRSLGLTVAVLATCAAVALWRAEATDGSPHAA